MTHVLAIARREVEERAFVFVAAIAIALVSPLAWLTPYGSFADRKEAIVILAFFLAVAFTWGLAVLLGVTLVGRELTEKRLSFYFTRPISGAAIWFGKLAAAIALLALSFVIVSAFPLGVGGRVFRLMSTISRSSAVAYVLAVAVLLTLAGHLLSTWIRSRSPILALDFLALLAVLAIAVGTLLPLGMVMALTPAVRIVALLVGVAVAAAVGGGAWQLSRGRIDARRSHRALSTFFWGLIAVAAIAGFGYSRWVLAATPREIERAQAVQRGSVVHLSGTARGAYVGFAVNPANGSYVTDRSWESASRGDIVADCVPSPSLQNAFGIIRDAQPRWFLRVTRLDQEPKTLMSAEVTGHVEAIGVNDDGSRVAATVDHVLTVYDTASRHDLASVRVAFSRATLQFVSPDVVRIFAPTGKGLQVTDFDVRTRKLSEVTPPIAIANQYDYLVVRSTLIVRNTSAVEIRNLAAGTVETIPVQKDDGVWLMHDGRLAIFHRAAPAYIEIRRNGVQQRVIRFGGDAQGVRVSAEIGRGRLLVSTYGRQRFDTTTYIVDADSGAMSSPSPRTTPALSWPTSIGISDPDTRYRALVRNETGKMDVVDLQTGAIRPMFR